MAVLKKDFFNQWKGIYARGCPIEANAFVLAAGNEDYDSLQKGDVQGRAILNYVDALTYGNGVEALLTNRALQNVLGFQDLLTSFLQQEEKAFDRCKTSALPINVRMYTEEKALMEYEKNIQIFKDKYIGVWRALERAFPFFTAPPIPLQVRPKGDYPELLLSKLKNAKGSSLLFLMQPWQGDCSALIEELQRRQVLLLFLDSATLFHCLSHPALARLILAQGHNLLILNIHLTEQIEAAAVKTLLSQPIEFFSMVDQPLIKNYEKELASLCVQALQGEARDCDLLYRAGRDLADALRVRQLGLSRYMAFNARRESLDWYSPHKQSGKNPLRPPPFTNQMGSILEELPPREVRFDLSGHEKMRVAHVVPQIVDGGHAPTKLLKTLLKYHNSDRYELFVFSSERLFFRNTEYPYNPHNSPHSSVRGQKTIEEIRQAGFQIYIEDGLLDFRGTAERIAEGLRRIEADIVIFHGPDMIHMMAAQMCETPLRVILEHGTLPEFPCFDLLIASGHDEINQPHTPLLKMGMALYSIPFAYDATGGWDSTVYPKSRFGLNEDDKILTTISNNLDSHLSETMCEAIAQILKKCPQAYYLPMGRVRDEGELLHRFKKLGVADRIKFLGEVPNPSQLARSMDLYMNEFPFGSGLAILDALAAGCPLVSMHDVNGPPQARYGGAFFGLERVIVSGAVKDYVELAVRLLTDADMYREWSSHALTCYRERADTREYVHRVETALEEQLSEHIIRQLTAEDPHTR